MCVDWHSVPATLRQCNSILSSTAQEQSHNLCVIPVEFFCCTGCVQLFGHYAGAVWQTGLLTAAVQKASQQAEVLAKYGSASNSSSTVKWIVLDGELNPAWIDGVNSFLTEPYSYYSLNSDITTLHGQFLSVIQGVSKKRHWFGLL